MKLCLVLAAAVATLVAAAPASAEVTWLCRPGLEDNPCEGGLETTVYEEGGDSRVVNPRRDAQPAFDCFYVYPTVSNQPGTNANKARAPEVEAIALFQAARFSQHCRVFAPIYRQLTVASIFTGSPEARRAGGRIAYGDVLEAWRDYLKNDNGGRPFVLIGHSQGTRMLRELVREEVDPNPALRRRLVSALLLGGNVLVRKGSDAGGDFRNIPTCASPLQFGCVAAFSSYNAQPPEDTRFGRAPKTDTSGTGFPAGPNYEVACTNPASLAANARRATTTLVPSKPYPPGLIAVGIVRLYGGLAPTAPTPWLQPADRYTVRCERTGGAHVLMVEPIGNARELTPSPDDTWGLHLVDVNIAFGELVALVASQARARAAVRSGTACLPQRSTIGLRRVGRIRLGRTRSQLERRAGPPAERTRWTLRWCVKRSSRRVVAVFSGRGASGKSRLVVTAARGYRARGVGAGRTRARLERRFPSLRRRARGVLGAGTRIFRVRAGRVHLVGAASRSLLVRPGSLRRYLRRSRAVP